jgi:hypothetical protein
MYSNVLEASSAGGGGVNLQKAQKKTTPQTQGKTDLSWVQYAQILYQGLPTFLAVEKPCWAR